MSAAPRAPAPAASHCCPVSPQETLRHTKAGLAQSLWGLWVVLWTKFFWALQASLVGMEFDSKCHHIGAWSLILNAIILGLLLWLWKWSIFFVGANILLLMCSAKSCNFGVLAGEDEHTSFYSAILYLHFSHICTVFCQLYLSMRLSRWNRKVF